MTTHTVDKQWKQLCGTSHEADNYWRPKNMCWTWTAKLLSIEQSLFIWRSSDRKDTTGPEAEAREFDVIKDTRWSEYNLMSSLDRKDTAGPEDRSRGVDVIKDTNGLSKI